MEKLGCNGVSKRSLIPFCGPLCMGGILGEENTEKHYVVTAEVELSSASVAGSFCPNPGRTGGKQQTLEATANPKGTKWAKNSVFFIRAFISW